MNKFHLGQKVFGQSKLINKATDEYETFEYEGEIIKDFEDDSYLVKDKSSEEILVELYDHETMYTEPVKKEDINE